MSCARGILHFHNVIAIRLSTDPSAPANSIDIIYREGEEEEKEEEESRPRRDSALGFNLRKRSNSASKSGSLKLACNCFVTLFKEREKGIASIIHSGLDFFLFLIVSFLLLSLLFGIE